MPTPLKHGEITDRILGSFYHVYRGLGYGFLEPVYQAAMAIDLVERGLRIQTHGSLPVWFNGHLIGDFRPDFIVEDCVIVELKSGRVAEASAVAQVINYLKASRLEVGLLLHFGPKPQFHRLVFDNERKTADADVGVDLPRPLKPSESEGPRSIERPTHE